MAFLSVVEWLPIVHRPLQGCQVVFSPLSLRSKNVAALINAR
jgi:hypothetical protein